MFRSTSLSQCLRISARSPNWAGILSCDRLFSQAEGAGRGDVRVLKAQLDLTAQSVQATRLTAPFWALAVALSAPIRWAFSAIVRSGQTLFPSADRDLVHRPPPPACTAIYQPRRRELTISALAPGSCVDATAGRFRGLGRRCPGCCGSRAIRSTISFWPPAPRRGLGAGFGAGQQHGDVRRQPGADLGDDGDRFALGIQSDM